MPILKKEEFVRITPPDNLKDDDRVFYNHVTNEVFTDYDDYFARVILCNSLVWTCSLTGKSGLTFQDAQESEDAAKEMIKIFPHVLRRPVLFVTNLTNRGRFADLVDDVFVFTKDRFFVKEQIDYVVGGKRKSGKILRIHPLQNVGAASNEAANSAPNGPSPRGKKNSADASNVVYDVEDADSKAVLQLSGKDLLRNKRTFTRDRLRVFLKLATETRNGVIRVVTRVAEKYQLDGTTYSDIHVGKAPEFTFSPVKRISKNAKEKMKEPKSKKTDGENNKENKHGPNSKETKEKKPRKSTKLEDKLIKEKFDVEWHRPRDDLTVDGLQELPTFTSFDCGIPQEAMSDAMTVLEFFSVYQQELRVKDYFSSGITFDILEKAVKEVDILGPLVDIFQILLTNLFKLKDAENNFNYHETTVSEDQPDHFYAAQKNAVRTLSGIRRHLGFSLTHLTLDSFTLSEILRLHIESCGAPGVAKKYGNFQPTEDPAFRFCIRNAELVERLRRLSVFELAVDEKLKLLRLIVDQLLCTDGVRDMIEEAFEAYRSSKTELRKLCVASRPTPESKPAVSPREFERREAELKDKIKIAQEKLMMAPLGEDRAYRRYYLLYSIPAVVVEDDVTNIGSACIDGGSLKEKCTSHSLNFMRQFVQASACENSPLTMLTRHKEDSGKADGHVPFTCTGDGATCLIHNRNLKRETWKFLSTTDQLDSLIKTLDNRGVREKSLKVALKSELENLRWAIEKCPKFSLNRIFECAKKTKQPAQNIKDSNLYGVEPSFALELSFKEVLLELEERIASGGLGHFKHEDRDLWRSRLMEVLDLVAQKSKPDDINALRSNKKTTEVLNDLGKALIDVALSVEKKVLMAPLGEAEPQNRNKKSKEGITENFALLKGNLEAWMRELRSEVVANGDIKQNGNHHLGDGSAVQANGGASIDVDNDREGDLSTRLTDGQLSSTEDGHSIRNFSRLFLLMSSLERSVMWMRALKNAACRICRKKSDPEQMLLCDGCDHGYHMYCLKPPISDVPQGDWFCTQCVPTQLSPRKRTKAPVEVSSEEDEDIAQTDEVEMADDADVNQEVCNVCEVGGELILCDFCPKAFHLECIQLKRVPRGDWKCPRCVKSKKSRKQSPQLTKVKVKGRSAQKFDLTPVSDVESFEYMVCTDIIKLLIKTGNSWPFLERVSRKDAPDYYKVIKKPMDFGTITGKLNDIKYKSNAGFVSDVFQIIANCLVYNNPHSDEVKAANGLSKTFCEMLSQVGLECLIDLKETILEETEESSDWSKGRPRGVSDDEMKVDDDEQLSDVANGDDHQSEAEDEEIEDEEDDERIDESEDEADEEVKNDHDDEMGDDDDIHSYDEMAEEDVDNDDEGDEDYGSSPKTKRPSRRSSTAKESPISSADGRRTSGRKRKRQDNYDESSDEEDFPSKRRSSTAKRS